MNDSFEHSIVRYSNWLNDINFNKFGAMDENFFFALCSRLKEMGTDEIELTFAEIRKVVGYRNGTEKEFTDSLIEMNKKLGSMQVMLWSRENPTQKGRLHFFNIFDGFVMDYDCKTLTVSVNQRYEFVINGLVNNFTKFELQQFISLDSKYSKTLFRLLKQWRTVGEKTFTVEELHERMCVPKSKTYTVGKIYQKIVYPAFQELKDKKYFENLMLTVNKAPKKGAPIASYTFKWKKETPSVKSIEEDIKKPVLTKRNGEIISHGEAGSDDTPMKSDDFDLSDDEILPFN